MNASRVHAKSSSGVFDTPSNSKAAWLLPAALAYTLFPIYGSLIPFVWRAMPWGDAITTFMALLQGPLSLASRADFAANVLLAIPLATLWQAALVGGRARGLGAAQLFCAVWVWLACTALALGLEFSQLFFSGRLPTLSDCVAQSIGALLGIFLWGSIPPSFWLSDGSQRARWKQLTALYLGGMSLYAVMPLDLTVSLSELAGKFSAGMVRLLPFAGFWDQPLMALIDALLDVAIWVGATLLAMKAQSRPAASTLWGLLAWAVLIEFAQLLVLSRVVDATDIVTAAFGIALGARLSSLSSFVGTHAANHDSSAAIWHKRAVVPLVLVTFGLVLRAYPFDFVTEAALLRQRLQQVSWIPFATYTANGELYLVTNLLRRFFLFVAIGIAVEWTLLATPLRHAWRTLLVATFCAAAALIMTVMQLLLPQGYFDLGDVLLAAVCGAVAASVTRRFAKGFVDTKIAPVASAAPGLESSLHSARPRAAGLSRARRTRVDLPSVLSQVPPIRLRLCFGLAMVLLPLVLMALAYSPAVPYNARELLTSGGWPWPVFTITPALLGLLGVAAIVVPLAGGAATRRFGQTTACLFFLPMVISCLIYLGVDLESVHDVVGSPVWGGWAAGEVMLRLAVLLLGVCWSFSVGVALSGVATSSSQKVLASVRMLLHGVWIVPLWHAVVVVWAGTDNLTELMAGGGSPAASLGLLTYGALLGWTASEGVRAVAANQSTRWFAFGLLLILSAALGYGLAHLATEPTLMKYNKVFSALQFLLSTDRNHYAKESELLFRFGAVHVAAVIMACMSMLAVQWSRSRMRSASQYFARTERAPS